MDSVGRIHGGNLREAAEKYALREGQLLDFSANINPLGPSPKAVDAILHNLDLITRYPDSETKQLRLCAASKLGLPETMIAAGNGAVELIDLLVRVLTPTGALIPAPTFNEYEHAVRVNGGKIRDLFLAESKGFTLVKEELTAAWHDCELIFICNPNNPTGVLTEKKELINIIDAAAAAGKNVVVDEAFIDFVENGADHSVIDLLTNYNNLFVLYSLTKFFAIPGLRLGLLLGNPAVISSLNKVRDPWNVNALAQLAGTVSIQDKEYIEDTSAFIAAERNFLYQAIKRIKNLHPFKPTANYLFINVEETGYTSTEIRETLGQQGILVRDCASFKNLRPVYIRVAVRTRAENLKLISALDEIGGMVNV